MNRLVAALLLFGFVVAQFRSNLVLANENDVDGEGNSTSPNSTTDQTEEECSTDGGNSTETTTTTTTGDEYTDCSDYPTVAPSCRKK